jgi:transposase
MTRREELLGLARAHPEALADYVLALEARVRQLEATVQRLEARLQDLEGQLAQNSRNSGKPPGSDGLAKPAPQNLRPKTERRPGGQPGHVGRTLQPVKKPDRVVTHRLARCPCGQCRGVSLRDEPVQGWERRQVFDLPPLRLEVTEHQAETKRCPVSGRAVTAAFPPGVAAPVQYGPNFQTLTVYLSQQQLLPHDRLSQLCEDLFGQPLSTGTIVTNNLRVAGHLAGFEAALVTHLRQAPVLHVDESGLRVAGQLHWLHVACTAKLTFYGVHPKRGTAATDAFAILPHCRGWLIHDHWTPYFTYDQALHGLCNQHLLRELKFVAEERQEAWAGRLSAWLVRAYRRRQQRGAFSERQFHRAHARYRAILRAGRRLHPRGHGSATDPGRKTANLLDRLQDFDLCVLAFLFAPEVPFTNNQAEQDIRMIKLRQKISGGFRTLSGARAFARVRSYLSSWRKQGRNLWEAIGRAVIGQPFMPELTTAGP